MISYRKLIVAIITVLIVLSTLPYHPIKVSAGNELTFIVDTTMDLPDFAVGNSVCSAGDPTTGPCTLRAAISEANANLSDGPVTILVPPGVYSLSILPILPDSNDSGDLDISPTNSPNTITIQPTVPNGEVTIMINGPSTDRILQVGWGAHVLIRDVKFAGAHLAIQGNAAGGGAILNEGSLTLERTSFTSNSVTCAPGFNCTSYVIGGAILNHGSLFISDSEFNYNSADRGFAIFNSGASTTCQIHHSLFMQNSGVEATIYNWTNMSIFNSTITANFSKNGWLAGISNETPGQLRLHSCTVANAGNQSSIANSSQVFLSDNIFKAPTGQSNFYDWSGTWNSGGYNIFSDDGDPVPTTTGDLVNTDPILGGLGNYGGPTMTHGLRMNSPAINHRPGNCATALFIIEDDQRHQPRSDGRCDSGAFELGGVYLPLINR